MYLANNMAELKAKSIPVTEEVEFFNPIPPTDTKRLSPSFTDAYCKSYAIKNGIICFLDEALSWYVIPALKGVRDLLKLQGYKQVGIFVPGADGAYPVQYKEHWEELLKKRNAGF